MKSVSFINIISFTLAMTIPLASTAKCPANTGPCDCFHVSSRLQYTCKNFKNIIQVQQALRLDNAHVETLDIIHHNLSELPNDIFQEVCIGKMNLNLPLLNIPDSLFSNQKLCLYDLTIISGKMEKIPINALISLERLHTLTVSNNHITELKDSLWKLPLRNLYLDSNKIAHIHSKVFPSSLRRLTLRNNHFRSLNSSLLRLTNLTYLDISNNSVETLHDELKYLKNLKHFDASRNQIDSIDDSLYGLTKLRFLNFSRNELSSIAYGLEDLNNLEKLDLSYNSFTKMYYKDFEDLSNLKELSLAYNPLKSLGNSLNQVKNLKNLYLNGNRLFSEIMMCFNQLAELGMTIQLIKNVENIIIGEDNYVINKTNYTRFGNNVLTWALYTVYITPII